MHKIKYIVIHCSDSPDERESVNAEEIHAWHCERGFDGIGYHFVILKNGTVEAGRPIYWQGAHAVKVNKCSLGICLVGRSQFTHDQFCNLRNLITQLKHIYPEAMIKSHYQFDEGKSCPNFDAEQWWEEAKDD